MIRGGGGIPKCFECQKLATIRCYDCLNEFEEPKTFCFVCDNSIHKRADRDHQKQTISFNQQLDSLGQQYQNQQGQNYRNQRNEGSRLSEQRNESNNLNYRQNNPAPLQIQDYPRENLQFFKDLKYNANHQSVRNNISEDRFKNNVAGPLYSNKYQNYVNYSNNYALQPSNKIGNSFTYQPSSQKVFTQQNNSLQQEPKINDDFERRYQHKLNVKRQQKNYLYENQLLSNQPENNHDSFLSNEDDKLRVQSQVPHQQELSDEEGDTKGFIQVKPGSTLQNRQNVQAQENQEQARTNTNPNNIYTKSSDHFKQQLEREIQDLKKYQNFHYNKYSNSNVLVNQDYMPEKEDELVTIPNNNQQEEIVHSQPEKGKSAEEEYKTVKNDINQYFGQKELDERENEVLKRISEIKKKIQPVQNQEGNLVKEQERGERLIYNYRDQDDVQQIQPVSNQRVYHSKQQRLNSQNNERKEQEQQSIDQVGSAKKLKTDFENLISQVGPNEEKSYIEGLKNIYSQEIKNIEVKHKIKIQELENTISYLRQHMDLMEERNKDNISSIQSDLLKQQKLVIEQERDSKFGINELRLQYQEENNHLQLQLETEKAKNIQLERKLNEYQQHYQNKLREMADNSKRSKLETEGEKVKLQEYIDEMDEKIEDIRVKMVQENEVALQKIKIDYDSSIEDLKDQLKEKSEQIAKLEKQLVADSQAYHEKERQIKKETQEIEKQLTLSKNELGRFKENNDQYKCIATDQENEIELMKKENELLEEQKLKLEDEKAKLEEQVEKFQKYIYGDKKEKSIIQQLKGASSKPSLSRASSASIKSTSSKNSKKKDN